MSKFGRFSKILRITIIILLLGFPKEKGINVFIAKQLYCLHQNENRYSDDCFATMALQELLN